VTVPAGKERGGGLQTHIPETWRVVRPSNPSKLNGKGVCGRSGEGSEGIDRHVVHKVAQSKDDCSIGGQWAAKGGQDKVEWEWQGTSWKGWKGDAGEWRLGCCCHRIGVDAIDVDQLEKREKRLLRRVRVWPTGGTVGKAEINFTVAESRGFLYRKAREATEIVIGRCELFPSVM